LGGLAYSQGDYATGRPVLEQSLSICRQLDNKPEIALLLNILGTGAHGQGEYAGHARFTRKAFNPPFTGRSVGIARSLNNLGNVVQ